MQLPVYDRQFELRHYIAAEFGSNNSALTEDLDINHLQGLPDVQHFQKELIRDGILGVLRKPSKATRPCGALSSLGRGPPLD